MTETEDPGYAERDDDEFSAPTGDGVEPDLENLDLEDLDDDDGVAEEDDV